jgi:Pyridoxal-dependent decarboxylase conserved domain
MGFDPAQAFDPERFRREGRAVVDWIADYWQTVASRPVAAQVEPGWVRSQLPDRAPEAPESLAEILRDLDRIVVPGLTHWQHPGFFGYFPAVRRSWVNLSPPASACRACSGPRLLPAPNSRRTCSTGFANCWACRRGSRAPAAAAA